VAWYSIFANFYDGALERLYAPHRETAFASLPDFERALVVPCGTGQDLPHLIDRGQWIVGVDLSRGMLARARERVAAKRWDGVTLLEGDATQLDGLLADHPAFDLALCSLGLTVVPDYEAVVHSAWSRLRPGATMAIFDVWAETRTFQTKQVELLARADLNRKVWEPLEAIADDFELRFIDEAKPSMFGGRLFIATGRKL
jgi:ubiquinone/menaquinone biosynthesis C-methylase UbiE